MNITMRMAWRNLWRHPRRTWITVGAMIFSNILLVFMISLQFGSYQTMIDNTLKSYTGHMQIQREGFNENAKLRTSFANAQTLANVIRDKLNSNMVAARGVSFAMTSSEKRSYGLQLIGVEPEFEPNVSTLPGLLMSGHYFTHYNAEEIIIGNILARNLQVNIGDELTLLGGARDGSIAAGVVVVKGIFDAGNSDINRHMAQLPLGYFQTLFGMGSHGHNIVINAEHLVDAPLLQKQIIDFLPTDKELIVLDWNALLPGLQQAIQADMVSGWFMYAILIVLVAFSVLNTQLMSVLERTHEFGTMLALGVKPSHLSGLVITETFLLSALGLAIGATLGATLVYYFSVAGFSYPGLAEMGERYNLPDRIYPSISIFTMLIGPFIVFISSILSSLYPSLRLHFLHPVKAMRAI